MKSTFQTGKWCKKLVFNPGYHKSLAEDINGLSDVLLGDSDYARSQVLMTEPEPETSIQVVE